jgi:hypothetical protein
VALADEVETRAMLLHAARHPGYGHVCGDCRAVAAGAVRDRRARRWRFLAVLASIAFLVSMCSLSHQAEAAPAEVPPPVSGSVTISGLDLHDGTIVKDGNRYVMVGTRYGCGFQWGINGTPWCGLGVSTAPSLSGPWSTPTLLFNPDDLSPYAQMSFRKLCGSQGAGCFNPRLVQRTGWGPNDGAWILWFNAPADFPRGNAYYALGCNSPTGPCGVTAGPPFGSTGKPSLWSCHDNGDFSIVRDDPRPPMMLCTMADQTLASERVSFWGASGEQGTGRQNLAGAIKAEAPGAYRDPSGVWVMTWNEFNCGYCAGAPTSYATSTAVDGAWTSPGNANLAWGATPLGRRGISATSCGGQARTITVLDGQAYQVIDLWVSGRNQTQAPVHLEPLTYRGAAPHGQPHQPFAPWMCGAQG